MHANESPIFPLASASASGVASPPHSTTSTDQLSWRMLSMSTYTPNEQFTVSEKVELLVNILQSLVPDLPSYLLHIIVDLPRPPLWMDIALPKGRTLHACQIAFEEMRKSMLQQPGPMRQQISSTPWVNIAPATAIPPGRSVSESDPLLATRRPLQPRPTQIRATESPHPPVTNGESPVYSRGGLLDPASEPSKKRGRPTKAEVAERDKAYAERGQTYQPKKRSAKRMRPSIGPDALPLKDEDTTSSLLQTPQRITTPVEETSSGKRRSRRQPHTISPIRIPSAGADPSRPESEQRQEQEQGPENDPGQEPEVNVAESPSDRVLAGYRDRGSVASSLSRRTQQESDTLEQGHFEPEFPT